MYSTSSKSRSEVGVLKEEGGEDVDVLLNPQTVIQQCQVAGIAGVRRFDLFICGGFGDNFGGFLGFRCCDGGRFFTRKATSQTNE